MRFFPSARTLAIPAIVALLVLLQPGRPALAVRHHFYVGTITSISTSALVIHSKSHNTNFTFVISTSTRFLRKGQDISRSLFKVGSYVTVSYSPGSHGTMVAYHVSLRR